MSGEWAKCADWRILMMIAALGCSLPGGFLPACQSPPNLPEVTPHAVQEAAPPAPPEPIEPVPPPVPVYPPYTAHEEDAQKVEVGIEGAEHLAHYYRQLAHAEMKIPGVIARAGHWGDSVLGGDGLTEAIRKRLQTRFGDAGHGYHALGKYNRWYRHRGLRYKEKVPWETCMIIYKCRKDMKYGYGGITSVSWGGARSWVATSKKGFGQNISRFEVLYAKHKRGGRFEIRVDGKKVRTVDTRAEVPSDEVEVVHLEDGPHEMEVVARGHGLVKSYGVVLEREVPGAVWDELSLIGSLTQRLDYQEPQHLTRQLQNRDSDLVVFILGGNDVSRERSDLKHTTKPYEKQYSRVIEKFMDGDVDHSCLIMALIDHVKRIKGKIVTREIMPRLVAAQRKVAAEHGCAFFDTFAAMGGDGSFRRWHNAKPRLAAKDLHHPTVAGQRRLGNLFYEALIQGYVGYRQRIAGTPLPEGITLPVDPATKGGEGMEASPTAPATADAG